MGETRGVFRFQRVDVCQTSRLVTVQVVSIIVRCLSTCKFNLNDMYPSVYNEIIKKKEKRGGEGKGLYTFILDWIPTKKYVYYENGEII